MIWKYALEKIHVIQIYQGMILKSACPAPECLVGDEWSCRVVVGIHSSIDAVDF